MPTPQPAPHEVWATFQLLSVKLYKAEKDDDTAMAKRIREAMDLLIDIYPL